MKCIAPGGNVKILAKAIQMLAKTGDEMYVNPQRESISFRTVNMAKSAYSDFTFHKNFFSYYTLEDLEEEEAQKCKISMRSAMTVFKSAHTLDKQVETCHICLEVDACNLVFILKYKNGITKSHLSPILDCEKLQASYSRAGMHNELVSQPRMLVDALQNFPSSLIEITLQITPNKLLLRNYIDEASMMVNTTRTQLALSVGEFDRYTVDNETTITFCLKEVRAFLTFSESANVPITVNFETTGKPMLLALRAPSFEANLLLSTLSLDNDSQSESSVVSRQVHPVRRRNTTSKGTSKRGRKASGQVKKSVCAKSLNNNTLQNQLPEEEPQITEETLNQNRSMNIIFAETNSTDDARERNHMEQNRSKQNPSEDTHSEQNRLLAGSPASTSTTIKRISGEDRKLARSVFSSVTKRKSTHNGKHSTEEETTAGEYFNSDVPRSPPLRRVAKKAKLVFQKCFKNTFDPRMLPGHDVVLVEDSDENSD